MKKGMLSDRTPEYRRIIKRALRSPAVAELQTLALETACYVKRCTVENPRCLHHQAVEQYGNFLRKLEDELGIKR